MLQFVPVGEDPRWDSRLYNRAKADTRRRVLAELREIGFEPGSITADGFELIGPPGHEDEVNEAVASNLMKGTGGFHLTVGGYVAPDGEEAEIVDDQVVIVSGMEDLG